MCTESRKSRGFFITSFLLTDVGIIEKIKTKYCVIGQEDCPTTGRPHIHAYIYFENGRSLAAIRKLIPGANIQVAHGSPSQNKAYVTKNQSVLEVGDMPNPGKRSDLQQLFVIAQNGGTFVDAVETCESGAFRYEKYFKRMQSYFKRKNYQRKNVIIYWGKTGTGKTRRAHGEFGEDLFVAFDYKWFDGYDGHKAVLFDEFTGEHCLTWMLRLCDGYRMQVQVKGGVTEWEPETVIFTSNINPKLWWPDAKEEHRLAFFRRVTTCIELEPSLFAPPSQAGAGAKDSGSSI